MHVHRTVCMPHNPRSGRANQIIAGSRPVRTHNDTVNALLFGKVQNAPINMTFDNMCLDVANARYALFNQTPRAIKCLLSELLALRRMGKSVGGFDNMQGGDLSFRPAKMPGDVKE